MAKKKSKDAKFFCENCGAEVPGKARVCTNCGRFFAAVRCPKCGKTGSNNDFKKGCPACGYAINGSHQSKKSIFTPSVLTKGKDYSSSEEKPKKVYEGSLPVWVYIFTIMVLAVLVGILYSCL